MRVEDLFDPPVARVEFGEFGGVCAPPARESGLRGEGGLDVDGRGVEWEIVLHEVGAAEHDLLDPQLDPREVVQVRLGHVAFVGEVPFVCVGVSEALHDGIGHRVLLVRGGMWYWMPRKVSEGLSAGRDGLVEPAESGRERDA